MYIAKSATEIHMIGEISFDFPVKSFNTTQEIIANIIPVAMEYAKGIITIARKPPIASATSPSKSILVTAESISKPTNNIAGVVANPGIARNNGAKGIAIKKRIPVVKAVKPVLPPAATPAEDST